MSSDTSADSCPPVPAFPRGSLRAWWPALAGPLLFVALGALLIPYPGLQEDEVIFAPPAFHATTALSAVRIHRHHVPIMLMSYLGATKSWLYAVIFRVWRASRYSVRVPLLVLYASTIAIFFAIAHALHGWRAAAAGTLLLATDPTYILTGSFAWCSLQNVLMVAAAGFGLLFLRTGRPRWLALSAFASGVWLWDKALALWILSGFFAALLLVFPGRVRMYCRWRNLAIALPAFCLGAFPLIVYNVTHNFATFRSNAHFSTAGFASKVQILRLTASGSAWLGYIVYDPPVEHPLPPKSAIERWSANVHGFAGNREADQIPYAFLAALLLVPAFAFQSRRTFRLLCFLLIVLSATWFQMAFTEGAGEGGHHPALLWPIPQLFIAIAFAEASLRWNAIGRWLICAVVAILMLGNILTVNQYLYQFFTNGGEQSWSDAIYGLSDRLSTYQASTIIAADWGIANPVMTLHRGKLPVQRIVLDAFLTDQPTEHQRSDAQKIFRTDNALWIAHTSGNEAFPGINAGLDHMIATSGYRRAEINTIRDRNNRPVFTLFRLVRDGVGVPR